MKRLLPALAALASLAQAHALDGAELNAMLDESILMWEHAVPWTSLGTAPSLGALDPEPAMKAVIAEIRSKGRYDEFDYLFDFYDQQVRGGRIAVREIEAPTPTPGFWPARLGGSGRAIVISSADLRALEDDPALYRSSFLRALAAIYYVDREPVLTARYRSRNVVNEFCAFMSALWVEALYLGEILEGLPPGDAAPDYRPIILESLFYDNLASASRALMLVDMDYTYYFVRILRAVDSEKKALDFLEEARAIPPGAGEALKAGLYGPNPSAGTLTKAFMARSYVMMAPWFLLSFRSAGYDRVKRVAQAMDRYYASTLDLAVPYRLFDFELFSDYLSTLSAYRLRLPEEGSPSARSPLPQAAADALAEIPGAARQEWYCYCEQDSPFGFRGLLPLDEESALARSAFRFSWDEGGRLLAVEHYKLGRLRGASELLWAARVSVEYGESGSVWRWENAHGAVIANEYGWAMYGKTEEGGDSILRFYARDGRRVQDRSGAWQVRETTLGNSGYRLRYEDYLGRAWNGPMGYSIDERVFGEGSLERSLFDADGKPVRARHTGVHRIVRTATAGDGGHADGSAIGPVIIHEYRYYDELGDSAAYMGAQEMTRETIRPDMNIMEACFADGRPSMVPLGYQRMETVFSHGVAISQRYLDDEGGAVSIELGYHSMQAVIDGRGEPVETRYLDEEGNPAVNGQGIHLTLYRYTEQGILEEVAFYGPDGKAVNDETGAARIRWHIGPDGEVEATDVWDADGKLLTPDAPGAA